ncbi:MAG: methyltransferase domain-containing protein, partial [Deltaproteobacteria bacterium]|nr:methyltransferase domain-containing protein [Deltaproteobacteria bacterium]
MGRLHALVPATALAVVLPSAAAIAQTPPPAAGTGRREAAPTDARPGEPTGDPGQRCARHDGNLVCNGSAQCHFGWCYGGSYEPPKSFLYSKDFERNGARIVDTVLGALALRPGEVTVDVGAGEGWYLPKMARAVGPKGRVIATELLSAHIPRIEARNGESPQGTAGRIEARRVDDNFQTGLDDVAEGSLDAVSFINSFFIPPDGTPHDEHVEYLKKFRRMLKPCGRVVFHRGWRLGGDPPAEFVAGVFEEAGFEKGYKDVPLPGAVPERALWKERPDAEARLVGRGYIMVLRKSCDAQPAATTGAQPAAATDSQPAAATGAQPAAATAAATGAQPAAATAATTAATTDSRPAAQPAAATAATTGVQPGAKPDSRPAAQPAAATAATTGAQ